jgi:septal ring factor EnvC (AmiA/AmiB activator)
MGWVSVCSGLDEVHVEAGQRVQRGEWIGAADRVEFEVRVDGRAADPMPMLVQVPQAD